MLLIGLLLGACADTRAGSPSSAAGSHISESRDGAPTKTGAQSPVPYLNDSDNDPSGDEDLDNSDGKTTDDDNDYPEDHVEPENDRYHDLDDARVTDFGHVAGKLETQTIATVVDHYYRLAAAGNGANACTLLLPTFARALPEDYGQAPGPSYLRGAKTCQAVLSRLFRREHGQLARKLEVTGVRVEGAYAYALFGSSVTPAGYVPVEREHGTWWIGAMIGSTLP
ncbi:MAG TPA: hypothetical protein VIJ50_07940 [Solirubrobacteraceae bacterium]